MRRLFSIAVAGWLLSGLLLAQSAWTIAVPQATLQGCATHGCGCDLSGHARVTCCCVPAAPDTETPPVQVDDQPAWTAAPCAGPTPGSQALLTLLKSVLTEPDHGPGWLVVATAPALNGPAPRDLAVVPPVPPPKFPG